MTTHRKSAHMVRVNRFSCGPTYRFVLVHLDAAVEAGSVEDLNAVLIELGYCPVFEHAGRFYDVPDLDRMIAEVLPCYWPTPVAAYAAASSNDALPEMRGSGTPSDPDYAACSR